MNSEQDRPWHPAGETKYCIRLGVDYDDRRKFRHKHGTQFFWSDDKKSWYWISDEALPDELKPFVAPTKFVAGGLERLSLELVPVTCWFSNVRSHVSKEYWKEITDITAREAGQLCETCGKPLSDGQRECHEVFYYNDWTTTQKLAGFLNLCKPCHMVKHYGLARSMGNGILALDHLAAINEWPVDKAIKYVDSMISICRFRSDWLWHLDLSYLKSKFRFSVEVETAELRALRANEEYERRVRKDSLEIEASGHVLRDAPLPTEEEALNSAYRRWFEDLRGK